MLLRPFKGPTCDHHLAQTPLLPTELSSETAPTARGQCDAGAGADVMSGSFDLVEPVVHHPHVALALLVHL